jgi:hypothetical protein
MEVEKNQALLCRNSNSNFENAGQVLKYVILRRPTPNFIVWYTTIGRRRISRFQRHSLFFLPFQVETDFKCGLQTGDSSVAVVLTCIWKDIFFSTIKLLRVAPSE